jgi:hypothetical protein
MEIKERTIEIVVWDCGLEEHRHRSKVTAQDCYKIRGGKPRKKRTHTEPEIAERMFKRYKILKSFAEVAKEYDVSPQKANRLIRKHEKKVRLLGLKGQWK